MFDLLTCFRPNSCVLTRMERPNIIFTKNGKIKRRKIWRPYQTLEHNMNRLIAKC